MNILLLHVAADITNLRVVGPVFADRSFEFIPIPVPFGLETWTYADFKSRNKKYGETLADFLPSNIASLHPHPDPDFDNYTFSEPAYAGPRATALRKLKQGDILFFISSLADYDPIAYKARDTMLQTHQRGRKNKYVVGFFTIRGVVQVHTVRSVPELTYALLNLLKLLEEGEPPTDLEYLASEYQTLQGMGYVIEKENTYELTEEGKKVAEILRDALAMQKTEEDKVKLREEGLFSVEPITGSIPEDVIKANDDYKRLKPVDFHEFIMVAGDPERSALLTHATQLTERFERFSFRLNKLGQTILKRSMDTLRGLRWIDENAGRLLAEEIAKTNPNLTFDLRSCF
nr:hypothetical protein [Candidatus Njordarchaeota archaeon]